ncbi:MAG: P-II family nitrogen regulator [Acholeplasmataceae bacterium]|nr:P-II family nitrogen regulator [Acholeplasmataceae bacterium]
MNKNAIQDHFDLLCAIVNFGSGRKILKIAKQVGIQGGTVVLGKGTIKRKLLDLLDLGDVRKEIVLMITPRVLVDEAIEKMDEKFHFKKPNHGIVFVLSVSAFLGTGHYEYKHKIESRGTEHMKHNAIFVIVDKGRGELVVEAASEAGAKGGTIINARGSGIHETSKIFNMEIEPEKEMVLILIESELTEDVVASISLKVEIDQPGNGVMFVQDVSKTYGVR